MGFSLKKLAEEVIAQVNVFDGGKTAQTVRQARQVQPAVTQRAPQQPSYGSNPITNVVNRARDVVDANTPQDRYKRTVQNRPEIDFTAQDDIRKKLSQVKDTAINMPKAIDNKVTNAVNVARDQFDANTATDRTRRLGKGEQELYTDQQRAKGVGERSINNNIAQRGVNFTRAAAESVASGPLALGRGIGNAAGMQSGDYKRAEESERNNRAVTDQANATMWKTLRDPNSTQAQKDHAIKVLNIQQPQGMQELRGKIASENDPRRLAAAAADTALTVATVGMAGATKQGVNAAYKTAQAGKLATGATAKQATQAGINAGVKNFGVNTAKTALSGAGSGFAGAYTVDPNATLKQGLTGAVQGGVGGAVLPTAFMGAGYVKPAVKIGAKATKKVFNEAGQSLDDIFKGARNTYDNLPSKQGGFVANPYYKDGSLRPGVKKDQIFDGVDGKPRVEFDDSGASLVSKNAQVFEDVIDHPVLFEQYPELKNVQVRWFSGKSHEGGSYNPATGILELNKNLDDKSILSKSLHEIQHAIQDNEGFASGGNLASSQKTQNDLVRQMGKLKEKKEYIDWRNKRNAVLDDPNLTADEKMAIHKEMNDNLPPTVKQYQDLATQYARAGKEGLDGYIKTAGEAESRAVEARLNMTPAERAKTPFYNSLDVPKEDLIIRNGGGTAMSIGKADDAAPQVGKTPTNPTIQAVEEAGARLKTTQSNQLSATQNVRPDGYKASSKTRQQATQEAQSRPKQQPRQINQRENLDKPQPLLSDNMAQTDRTYANNTPEIDTKQYVKDMNKQQKSAGKGTVAGASKFGDAKEKFIDDLAPIEDRLNKAIKNGAEVDPKDHITYQLDRSRRAEGVMNVYMNDNGLSKVIQDVPNPKEFDQYLIARHAKELDADIRTGRDPAKDAALVKQLDGKYGEYAKKVYSYNQKLLDSATEYGLISKQTADALKKKYPEYVPLNRIFKEDELAGLHGNGSGSASISSQGVVNKLKGSERSIRSPLNSIIDKTRVVIEQGERNKSAQLLASYKDLPDNPFNLKEIGASETIGNRSTISFLDNGKKRVFEVDKEIADAAKNMNRQEIGMWGRIAAVPARVLRAGATSVNAGFAGANVVKDIVGAAINSKHPFRIADPRAMGKALAASLNHNGKYYQELMREGVAGTSFDMYRNALKSNIGEIRSQKNIGRRAAYNISHPSQWYRTVENTIGRSEDFGRALQYYSNKSGFEPKYGKSSDAAKILAADQARNNSTNFFRHGSYGKNLNLAIPYWNAGVQGTRITLRRVKERPVQTVAKIGLVIAAPSAMIAVNNYKDENKRNIMAQIEEYEKDGNIIIVGDDAKFNEQTGRWDGITKIPVPPQHLGIHKTIQNAIKSKFTGEKFNPVDNLGTLLENYTTIDPTDARQIANKYVPQGIKLIAEPMTNTNFFTGNKIVPESQKNLPAQDQYGDFTSGIAKVAGKLTNTSPRMIDNTIRTGMGGAGQNAVKAVDKALAKAGVIGEDEVRGKSIKDSITDRFVGAKAKSTSDKVDKNFARLSKEITSTDEYKNASQYDKQRMLNRLQSDISEVAYFADSNGKPGPDGKEQKLSTKQKKLLEGFDSANYTDLTNGGSLPKDLAPSAKKVLTEASEDKEWLNAQSNDQSIKDTLKNWNNGEEVPVTNEIAKAWAEYEKKRLEGKISDLEMNKEKKKVLRKAYSSVLNEDEKGYWDVSDTDIIAGLEQGLVTEESLKKALDVDALLVSKGLLSKSGFGKTVWNAFGMNAPKAGSTKTASSGGSRGRTSRKGSSKGGRTARGTKAGKYDYNIFGMGYNPTGTSKSLREIVKKATAKV